MIQHVLNTARSQGPARPHSGGANRRCLGAKPVINMGERVALSCKAPSNRRFTGVQLAATTAHSPHNTATAGDMTARLDLLRDAKFIPIPMKK